MKPLGTKKRGTVGNRVVIIRRSTGRALSAFGFSLLVGGIGLLGIGVAAQPNQPAPAAPAASQKPGTLPPATPAVPAQPAAPAPGTQPGQPSTPGAAAVVPADPTVPIGRGGYVYLPEGRRDPFLSILNPAKAGPAGPLAENLPPLQRFNVAELTVVGIIWGGFGYTAMMQTPDGRGYTVQRGAKIGTSNGIVTAITEKAVIVEERFTDIYGKKQVREYAKPLHIKEGTE